MPDTTWMRSAAARAEEGLAALSPESRLHWRALRRWLLGAPGDPLPSRADPGVLTRARVRATRHLPHGAADLVDALLVLEALDADADPRDAPLAERWRSFLEAAIEGESRRNPVLEHPALRAHGRLLDRVLASMRAYLRVGLYWWERTGVPRRWLLEAKGVPRTRLARYVLTQLGGFRPVWSSHLPALPEHRHLTEDDFIASHLEMAAMLRRSPEVRGIASASWYYDPALEEVSPWLVFAARIVREGGGMIFEVEADASTAESALASSAERRRASAEGRYTPRVFARVWGRRAFLAWAERQRGWQIPIAIEA